jgi:hypothetical protein
MVLVLGYLVELEFDQLVQLVVDYDLFAMLAVA